MQKYLLSIITFSMASFLLASQASAMQPSQMQALGAAFKSTQNGNSNGKTNNDMTIVYGGEDVANYPLLSMNSKA